MENFKFQSSNVIINVHTKNVYCKKTYRELAKGSDNYFICQDDKSNIDDNSKFRFIFKLLDRYDNGLNQISLSTIVNN
jgi:hypothetical protein